MLYSLINRHPDLIANYKFTDCEIAAANYLLTVANLWILSNKITDEQTSVINMVLQVQPRALELIKDLKRYDSYRSEQTCMLCQMVSENNQTL